MSTDPQCVFCKIVAGRIPAAIVHQSEQACAFLDIHPLAPGHLVVVPREHHATLTDLSPEAASSFFAELPGLARALLAATGVSDFNLLQNNGAAAAIIPPLIIFGGKLYEHPAESEWRAECANPLVFERVSVGDATAWRVAPKGNPKAFFHLSARVVDYLTCTCTCTCMWRTNDKIHEPGGTPDQNRRRDHHPAVRGRTGGGSTSFGIARGAGTVRAPN